MIGIVVSARAKQMDDKSLKAQHMRDLADNERTLLIALGVLAGQVLDMRPRLRMAKPLRVTDEDCA